jgi:hypothetical protein
MADNLLKYVPDLSDEDKKAIRYAISYELWRKIYHNPSALGFLNRQRVIAALRKAGTRACLATADKLARDK